MAEFSGSQLKAIRESRHIPLEQVAQATHIRLEILRDLEDEEYGVLASSTQARGFLKIYADYLGVEPAQAEVPEPTKPDPLETPPTDAEPPGSLENPTDEASSVPAPAPQPAKPKRTKLALGERLSKAMQSNNKPESSAAVRELNAPKPDTPSQKILNEIGRTLIARRRYLNIPWELIESQTRLSRGTLLALERGELENLPGTVQSKAFLQTYATFLNLDTDMLLIRFAEALQERRLESTVGQKRAGKTATQLSPFLVSVRRLFTLDLFFGTMMVLGILAFLTWGVAQMVDQYARKAPQAELPPVVDVLMATNTPSAKIEDKATATPAAQPGAVPAPTAAFVPMESDAPVQLVILSNQNAWIRVTADDEVVFQGRMEAGDVETVEADEGIFVETGNAAAFEFIWNSIDQPYTGTLGHPIRLQFTAEGMQELVIQAPASTPTGTGEPGLEPTPTPTGDN